MRLSLRSGEKIYINGAVLRVDRKVSLELMNDVTFLLEAHVMQPAAASTPLKRLYFAVQTMLMEPHDVSRARALFDIEIERLRALSISRAEDDTLSAVGGLVAMRRYFEALKFIRERIKAEDAHEARPIAV